MFGIAFDTFFATSLRYFFNFLLSCVSWCFLFVQTEAPFHQAGDIDIKADSILYMIMSDHIF